MTCEGSEVSCKAALEVFRLYVFPMQEQVTQTMVYCQSLPLNRCLDSMAV